MSSYVEINKGLLEAACQSYLDKRKAIIEREREEAIAEQMNKRWFPAKTREKAIENLKKSSEGSWWSEWERINDRGIHYANIVENLIVMCHIAAGDTVRLDREAVDILEKYL